MILAPFVSVPLLELERPGKDQVGDRSRSFRQARRVIADRVGRQDQKAHRQAERFHGTTSLRSRSAESRLFHKAGRFGKSDRISAGSSRMDRSASTAAFSK